MSLLLTMLPVYLLGNLHCIGMCGPLVALLSAHRYRALYFLGRILAFSLAGWIAGELGAVLNLFFAQMHLPAMACFAFGGVIIFLGILSLLKLSYPGHQWLARRLAHTSKVLALLMARDKPLAVFLFGFFTIALPCGQTLIVFSACAVAGEALVGLVNGFAFALLTSPSLLIAMHTTQMLKKLGKHYNRIMGILALIVGALALCRGLAEVGLISHLVLSPSHHVVIY